MNKFKPFVIEFETSIEEQKFLNWALQHEKEMSEGILRARGLIYEGADQAITPKKFKGNIVSDSRANSYKNMRGKNSNEVDIRSRNK